MATMGHALKAVALTVFAFSSFASASGGSDEPAICEEGGFGIALPLFGTEYTWPIAVQVVAYFLGLVYIFFGIAIISDLFMEGIEAITSISRVKVVNGVEVEYKVWNATVANLTLMALGSSAPEILLSVIEIFAGNYFIGSLGPATIVGSAAFNLFMITAVCMMALPDGEGRLIADLGVFAVTASSSIFAYLWLIVILMISSPNVVEVWEGVLTFMFFPVLVALAYATDKGWFRKQSQVRPDYASESKAGLKSKDLARQINEAVGSGLSEERTTELVKLLALQTIKPSRAAQRINAVRQMTGGKRVLPPPDAASKLGAEVGGARLAVVQFSSDVYMICEGDGKVFVVVSRADGSTRCEVGYESVGGTATPELDYGSVKGVLVFEVGDLEKRIGIDIVDDDIPEDDEYFTVKLTDPKNCLLGEWAVTTVIIIDDDEPGDIGFDTNQQEVSVLESKEHVELAVRRFNGSKGRIECKFRTKDMNVPNAAKAGADYVVTEGVVVFEAQQMQQLIRVPIVNDKKVDRDIVFKVVLYDPKGPTSDVAVHTHEDGSKAADCMVTIIGDDAAKAVQDKVDQMIIATTDKYKIGTSSYAQQFKDAFLVNGGDDEESSEPPSKFDYFMHYLTLPFKLLFATVPPSGYYGGYPCFFASLVYIGLLTALVEDLGMLFGCACGLSNTITAISIVALGTSLPDTFASKMSTLADDTADNAIGNVTGSNSVNVFLGLGLPWMFASIKWEASGITPEWIARYGSHDGTKGSDSLAPSMGSHYPNGAFVVPAGDLGFSVGVFTVCALAAFTLLAYRRKTYGFELGGPAGPNKMAAQFLAALWVTYIVVSAVYAQANHG